MEALPVGNGRLGAMIFGRHDCEQIQFNTDTLCAGGHEDRSNLVAGEYLEEVRDQIFYGRLGGSTESCRREADGRSDCGRIRRLVTYTSIWDTVMSAIIGVNSISQGYCQRGI